MKSLIFALGVFACVPTFAADTMLIDSGHSALNFHWNHFGFSNPGARFELLEGTVKLDPKDLAKSSVDVTIPVDSLHTGLAVLDKRLKTPEFFDAEKYKVITFKSTSVEKGPLDTFKVRGDLTVHGVSKSVVLEAKINKIQSDATGKVSRAGFDAQTVLKRSDFGVGKYVPAVTDDILVRLSVELADEL